MSAHFKKLVQFDTDYCASTITKYESTRTGLSSVVVDRKGPKLLGYFALATEIHDDSGAPHTLEHLVFMGSKSYRYKGLLDKLANRAYSSTNAWTATEQTVYTLDTAGWAGFAQILPVYLEHILVPTITDAGCYTEVHHIDATGHDAGVVYSEMQAVENTSDGLIEVATNRLLFPENIGYRYETGGLTDALRVLTTDRIREFHKEMYQPRNLCVIIIGEVDHDDLLNILEKFEDSIIADFPEIPTKRPWVDSAPVPLLTKSVVSTVEFPEKDESMGEVSISWLGPSCSDVVAISALTVLRLYLAGSSVSILEKYMVEIDEPYASYVDLSVEERPNSVISLGLASVPTKRLAEAEQKVFEVLKKTASEPVDLEYMRDCVKRTRRQIKFYLDLSGDHLRTPLITDFIYGERDGSSLKHLQNLNDLDVLEKWGDEEWRSFLSKWLADAHHVSVLGKPSSKLAKEIKVKEKARIEERIKTLGEEGLKELGKKLEAAKAENDKPIPTEVISQFKIPGVDSIHFINTTTARAGLARKEGVPDNAIQKPLDSIPITSEIPFYLHFEHSSTRFVHVNLIISTDKVPVELRPLLAVYMDNLFATPMVKDGERLEYEAVVSQLEKFTVEYLVEAGAYIGAAETIRVKIQIEPEQYATTIKWLKTILWDSIFDKKRLSVAVAKLLQDIPEEKRSGDDMPYSVARQIISSRESIGRARDTLVKSLYLKRIAKLLETDEERVIKDLETVRSSLCSLDNIRALVIADVERLENPVAAWKEFIEGRPVIDTVNKLDRRKDRLTPLGQNPGNVCNIVPLHSIDSSYSLHIAKGPDNIADPRLPALILAQAYLECVEGPLWVGVRGTGLAYGSSFSRNIDVGHLIFSTYRAPNAYTAFAAARTVVENHINGTTPFDPHLLEGALSHVVVTFAEGEANMATASEQSFINQVVHGVGKDWNARLLRKVKEVTEQDMRDVLRDVVMGCFERERSVVVVVAAGRSVPAISEGFEKDGFDVKVKSLQSFEDSYGLEVEGVVDEVEEEEGSGGSGSEGDEGESGSEDGTGSEEDEDEDEEMEDATSSEEEK